MIFTDILNIRDSLSQLAVDNNQRIAALLSDGDQVVSDFCTQVAGVPVSCDGDDLTIGSKVISLGGVTNHLSDVVDNSGLTVSDYLETMSSTGDAYSLLGSITTKFSYSNRVSLTDLNAMIDNVVTQQSLNYDITSLKDQLLAVSDNEGYVTAKSWLVSVRDWIRSCKEGTDNYSPDLDNTAPNTLSSIYNIISTVVETVLTTIFGLLGAIFGAIFNAIASVLRNLFSNLANYFNSGGTMDITAPNAFVKGVLISCESSRSQYHNLYDLTYQDYSINYCELPSAGFFFWQGQTEFRIRSNAYLTPKYSFSAIAKFINDVHVNGTDYGTTLPFSITVNTYDQVTKIYRNSNTQCIDYLADNLLEYQDDDDIAIACADLKDFSLSVAACEFYRVLLAGSDYAFVDTASSWQPSDYSMRMAALGAVAVMDYLNFNDPFHTITEADLYESITGYLNFMYSISTSLDGSTPYIVDFPANSAGVKLHYPLNPIYVYNKLAFTNEYLQSTVGMSWSIVSDVLYTDWYYNNSVNNRYVKANCLPCNFFVEYNGVSLSEVMATVVLASIVAISAAVIYTKAAKAIRIKKIKKQSLRSRNLAKLKSDWEADPDNTDKLNAYAQAVDKYNRIGRILHWGSYDAANGWVNSYSSANSVVSAIPQTKSILSKAVSTLQDIGVIDGKVDGISSAIPSVTDITTPIVEAINAAAKSIRDLIYQPNNRK